MLTSGRQQGRFDGITNGEITQHRLVMSYEEMWLATCDMSYQSQPDGVNSAMEYPARDLRVPTQRRTTLSPMNFMASRDAFREMLVEPLHKTQTAGLYSFLEIPVGESIVIEQRHLQWAMCCRYYGTMLAEQCLRLPLVGLASIVFAIFWS
jgi:hypothetical protein